MSEPPSKIIKLDSFSGPLEQAEMEEDEFKFSVVLCNDVFLEIIRWGNRRQLVKLERVGQRFHWNVERFFSKTPFLRLNLCLGPTSQAGEAKISDDVYMEYSDWTDISLTAVFPPFLRFDPVELIMSWSNRDADKARDKQSIIEKCQFFEDQLKLIKPEILNDSELCFVGIVDENDSSRFANHSELLKYLSDRILPICDKLRGYEFTIELHSDTSAGNYVLSSLLQMPQINYCPDVYFRICDTDQTKLPVDEISNWLHRKCDSQRERSLRIYLIEVGNLMEMLNRLKEAFEAAKFPVVPYTLALDVWLDGADGGTYTTWQVEELMLTNKTTNEQFSVEKEMDEEEMFVQIITITIKRGLKKKDEELNELVKEQ